MVTLLQSNPHLRDAKQTHRRIAENVRQSSAFEGVMVHAHHGVTQPRSITSVKKDASAVPSSPDTGP